MSDNDSRLKGRYVHYKNKQQYQVIGTALHTETGEQLVIYKPLYESEHEFFARPYKMFFGEVEVEGKMVKRFQEVRV